MCEPVTAGLMLAGTGLAMYGQLKQGQDQANQDIANQNLANAQSADAYQRGANAVGRARTEGTQTIGAEKVAYAASGVDLQSGTPLSTMADTRALSEQDAATLRNNAAREAWGYQVQASNFAQQARAAKQNAALGALATGLGGVGQAASILGRWTSQPTAPAAAGLGRLASAAIPAAAAPTPYAATSADAVRYSLPPGVGSGFGGLGRRGY